MKTKRKDIFSKFNVGDFITFWWNGMAIRGEITAIDKNEPEPVYLITCIGQQYKRKESQVRAI